MSILRGFGGPQGLVPDVTGSLRSVGQGMQVLRGFGQDLKSEQLAEQAAGGDEQALALLGSYNPAGAQHMMNLIKNNDAKQAAEDIKVIENRARQAFGFLELPDDQQDAWLEAEAVRGAMNGEDVTYLMEFKNLPPEQRKLVAQQNLVGAMTMKDIIGRRFPDLNSQSRVGAQQILPDGTIIQSTPQGPRVFGPNGEQLQGQAAADAVRKAQEYGAALAGDKSRSQQTGKLSADVDVGGAAADAKESGKGAAQTRRLAIDNGIVSADAIPVVRRGLALLNAVSTGGIQSTAGLAAKRMLGIETADEGELSGVLGKAVLSQLRPTFGAAFTEREGARLEAIEAGFGKNNETNKRLLAQALALFERAARRGIQAAEEEGDSFSANEIREAMSFQIDPESLIPGESVVSSPSSAQHGAGQQPTPGQQATTRKRWNPQTGRLE